MKRFWSWKVCGVLTAVSCGCWLGVHVLMWTVTHTSDTFQNLLATMLLIAVGTVLWKILDTRA